MPLHALKIVIYALVAHFLEEIDSPYKFIPNFIKAFHR